jgi:hypothetical protein
MRGSHVCSSGIACIMNRFDINFWICPILAAVMFAGVLWRHFFRRGRVEDELSSPPAEQPSPSLIQPVEQELFLERLLQAASWTNTLLDDVDLFRMNCRAVLRSINPVIDGTPAFRLTEDTVSWNHDMSNADNILRVSVDVIAAHKPAPPVSLQEIMRQGKIIAHETGVTTCDGLAEAESRGYVDIYDLPPADTWIYITPSTNTSRAILYCWVPVWFEEEMRSAMMVNPQGCYEWADIRQLLPDHV